jgi:hypothetical protein
MTSATCGLPTLTRAAGAVKRKTCDLPRASVMSGGKPTPAVASGAGWAADWTAGWAATGPSQATADATAQASAMRTVICLLRVRFGSMVCSLCRPRRSIGLD